MIHLGSPSGHKSAHVGRQGLIGGNARPTPRFFVVFSRVAPLRVGARGTAPTG